MTKDAFLSILGTFPDGGMLVSQPPFRLKADGSPAAALTFPEAVQAIGKVAINSDGSFIVVTSGTSEFLYRFLPDGTRDPAFSYAMPAAVEPAAIPDASQTTIAGLEVDLSGRIYVTYSVWGLPVPHWFPANRTITFRFKADGTVDGSFLQQDSGRFEYYQAGEVYALNDGRILRHGFGAPWAMLRQDGTVDLSWSSTVFQFAVVDRKRSRMFTVDTAPDDEYKLTGYDITGVGLDPFLSTTEVTTYPVLASDGNVFASGNRSINSGVNVVRILANRRDIIAPRVRVVPDTGVGGFYSRGHQNVRLKSEVYGTGPFVYQWLTLDHQPLPGISMTPELDIPDFGLNNSGRYQLRVTGPQGTTVLSNVIDFSIFTQPYLTNLSGRAMVGQEDDTAIAGFVLEDPLEPLIRGAGPALKQFGISTALPDPIIAVHDQSGAVVHANDDWEDDSSRGDNAYFGAFAFTRGSHDAHGLWSFSPGAYSVQLSDTHRDTGVGLLEVYSPPQQSVSGPMANLSFRAHTRPGENKAIAGFVISDPQDYDRPLKILLRAVGPTLASKGVAHPLADPVLTVYDAGGTVIATNNDWAQSNSSASAAALSATMQQVGAFELPPDSKDSALLLTLPPGVYSMHADGGDGIVLLEVYVAH